MSEYIFVTNIFKYLNIRIYSLHSGPNPLNTEKITFVTDRHFTIIYIIIIIIIIINLLLPPLLKIKLAYFPDYYHNRRFVARLSQMSWRYHHRCCEHFWSFFLEIWRYHQCCCENLWFFLQLLTYLVSHCHLRISDFLNHSTCSLSLYLHVSLSLCVFVCLLVS